MLRRKEIVPLVISNFENDDVFRTRQHQATDALA